MSEKSAKEMFKMLLEQKKQATQGLSKAELNQIEKLEEQKLLTRLKRRERYATDPEFKARQQEHARVSMRKNASKKKDVYESNEQSQQPVQHEEQVQPPPKKQINARNLF